MKTLYTLILAAAVFAALSFSIPGGWFKAGTAIDKYLMGVDTGNGLDKTNAITIQSTADTITGFGTLMENLPADKYKGKKIRVRGMMRSTDVKKWSAFWLRVDGAGGKEMLAFDNMHDRPITGTTTWKKYEIVLDVPIGATNIAFGALLTGTGKIWFDQVVFEEAPQSTKTTGLILRREQPRLSLTQ